MKLTNLVVAALLALLLPALAQSPYADMQQRPVKALSEAQVADLEAGRGMGLALAAELNGYPGPSHVLELADQLKLSAEQKERIQQLFDGMKAEAQPLGQKLLAEEASLDSAFASRSITPEALRNATEQIGATQARLRNAHLQYHLKTVQILSADQVKRYSELRGYGSGAPAHGHRH
jgi:Spy/CpxP family protein refolding chaperone